MITLGALIQVLGYVFLVPALPYPVMPICYSIIGLGMALQDAGANTYIATLSGSQQVRFQVPLLFFFFFLKRGKPRGAR